MTSTREDWQELWEALRDMVLVWVGRGPSGSARRPDTKPMAFWEWLIAEVRAAHPEVIFLAEAFTRPALMTTLAKAGFTQSYTYFAWKNTKGELAESSGELARRPARDLPAELLGQHARHPQRVPGQLGGRPAFEARLVLAATLSPSLWHLLRLRELARTCPSRRAARGVPRLGEVRAQGAPGLDGALLPLVARLNQARRANPAFQRLANATVLETSSEAAVRGRQAGGWKRRHRLVVSLDPFGAQEGVCVLPVSTGLPPAYPVRDLLTDAEFTWRIGRNYVKLPPGGAHVLRLGG